ncbi:hypothetical protein MBLNU13_g08585t1 [Cladosporium sp. NU13]
MTTPSKGLDPKETSPSRKSLDSQTSTRQNAENHKYHGNDAIPLSTTGEPATEQVDRSHLVANEDYSTGSIYFPALDRIGEDLGVSDSAMSITVTTYLIMQGLAPMMIAGFSDTAGRRPAYILCFTIYMLSNLALGLQNNYIALLVLRLTQSAGSSGTVALASGLVGDLVTSSERGQYIAYSSLGSVLGPTLSPVIGGLLSQYLDWHWIFWAKKGLVVDKEKLAELHGNLRIGLPNPMSTLVIFTSLEANLVLIATGFSLVCFYAISTGAASVLSEVYHYDEVHIGLVFLSIGGGSVISAFTTGKIVDWNYARHAKRNGYPVVKNRTTDLSGFPLERARVEIGLPCFVLGVLTVIGYGWIINFNLSVAGPIVMLFLLGYGLIAGFQSLNVLMVDLYPSQASSATAASNVVRCLLGAAASAAILPMSDAMGDGWAYTTIALMFLLSCGGLLVIMKYGIAWRSERKAKLESKREAS